jgi:hypothetical protein
MMTEVDGQLSYDDYERLSAGGALVPVSEIPGDLRRRSAPLSLAARSKRFLLEA